MGKQAQRLASDQTVVCVTPLLPRCSPRLISKPDWDQKLNPTTFCHQPFEALYTWPAVCGVWVEDQPAVTVGHAVSWEPAEGFPASSCCLEMQAQSGSLPKAMTGEKLRPEKSGFPFASWMGTNGLATYQGFAHRREAAGCLPSAGNMPECAGTCRRPSGHLRQGN